MEISINITIGEAIDRFSILEIKEENIKDENKLESIIKEKNYLFPFVESFIMNNRQIYNSMKIINEMIFNNINLLNSSYKDNNNSSLAELSLSIFIDNNARCRCKKICNNIQIQNFAIEEQKSYSPETIIFVTHPFLCQDVINLCTRFLKFYYDEIIYKSVENITNSQIPNLANSSYQTFNIVNPSSKIDKYVITKKALLDNLNENEQTINYVNSGCLGDTINVLYVIKTIFLTTGKKGNLFLNMSLGYFKLGERTVEDVREVLEKQIYINKVELLKPDTRIDINLDSWRQSNLLYRTNWIEIFSNQYNIPKIKMPYLFYDVKDEKFQNKIIINRSLIRHNRNFPWENLVKCNKCTFVSFIDSDYEKFPFKDNVEFIHLNTFTELVTILNSCRLFIGNLSMPSAVAIAMNIPCLIEYQGIDANNVIGLEVYNDNLNWISERNVYFNERLIRV